MGFAYSKGMKISKFLPLFLLVVCFVLIGCSSADPLDVTRGTAADNTLAQGSSTPVTVTAEQTFTPLQTNTAEPQVPAVTRTALPNTPTPTVSPPPTPTLYPDAWISGIIWPETEEGPTIYAGNSSFGVNNGQITYEALNETVAADIARFPLNSMIVFYGDYTPEGPNQGHIVVERVEQVNLDYSENVPFSESYSDPWGFSFSYPENWSLRIYDSGDSLSLINRPSDEERFYGPGIEYNDPTALEVGFFVRAGSVEENIQSAMDSIEEAKSATPDYAPTVTVTERVINNIPVTQIEVDELQYSNFNITYFLGLDNQTTLVIATSEKGSPVAERLLETLTLN